VNHRTQVSLVRIDNINTFCRGSTCFEFSEVLQTLSQFQLDAVQPAPDLSRMILPCSNHLLEMLFRVVTECLGSGGIIKV